MEIFNDLKQMQEWSLMQKHGGKTIALAPTMGALHEGHLSLLREGRHRADRLVLSIYVNPTQFGPGEDYTIYPRTTEQDLKLARDLKTDVVFAPTDEVMYPGGYQTYVTVEDVTQKLCGASRPGHFRGVTTVVCKLFNIIMPDVAVFGEKDYQQLVVIRRMVTDLNLPIDIVGLPTIREKDGLAMSSRNRYLSTQERKAALSLYRSLNRAEEMVRTGERDINTILQSVKDTILAEKIPHIDYIRLCDPKTLEDLHTFQLPSLLAIAAFIGPARLIDNRILK